MYSQYSLNASKGAREGGEARSRGAVLKPRGRDAASGMVGSSCGSFARAQRHDGAALRDRLPLPGSAGTRSRRLQQRPGCRWA